MILIEWKSLYALKGVFNFTRLILAYTSNQRTANYRCHYELFYLTHIQMEMQKSIVCWGKIIRVLSAYELRCI